ncbi:MAG TPA: hypothetical protein VFE58_04905 [Tepidisphaeraceae bacterium]|jgi:uncharacterized membrane protein|nr:hypothetical protein [Tepidisphaeraceae bacterium]
MTLDVSDHQNELRSPAPARRTVGFYVVRVMVVIAGVVAGTMVAIIIGILTGLIPFC